jgi:hypothetical protein
VKPYDRVANLYKRDSDGEQPVPGRPDASKIEVGLLEVLRVVNGDSEVSYEFIVPVFGVDGEPTTFTVTRDTDLADLPLIHGVDLDIWLHAQLV